MKTVILDAFRDEMTGELGLGIKGLPRDETTNAASDGLTVAHDLIEHVNGPSRIGTIDDELEALGAIWYVRGQHGELRRDRVGSRYNLHENIASDVTRMFRDFFYGAPVDTSPIRTQACEADDDLREIVNYSLRDARKEMDNDEPAETVAAREAEYMAVCLPRMRIGYRKAKVKYEKLGRYAANSLFWAIADAVEPYAKQVESEGMEFKLRYGFDKDGDAVAYCEERYQEGY